MGLVECNPLLNGMVGLLNGNSMLCSPVVTNAHVKKNLTFVDS